jgi:hypothetical protein
LNSHAAFGVPRNPNTIIPELLGLVYLHSST